MVEQLVLNCAHPQQQQQGMMLCNVRLLHKILMNECHTLPAAMSGQRSLILEVPLTYLLNDILPRFIITLESVV